MNLNNNNITKNSLKGGLNFSNDYFPISQSNINNVQNRFVSGNRNTNFIAPAYLKNFNTKNESIDRINKVNEYKNIHYNHLANQKNIKPKSICIKLVEKDIKVEMLNESFNQDSNKEQIIDPYSKEKYEESGNKDRVKNYSKEHFKDLKSNKFTILHIK